MVAVLLALSLVRPGAQRLKWRIVGSLSRGIGRPVEVGAVHVRFLPPGFELNDLRVADDPAVSAEPILRAAEVTAFVRLRSLLRGRLELSRLEITDPSLNLARAADGRWNVQPLLEHSARTPLRPTAEAANSDKPAFPYIEATGARINFKSGLEKKPFALINADVSLWQDSDNSWGMRLKGEPVRTDLSLSDTGILRVDGTWQRSVELRDTPLKFVAQWDGGQLGQLTRLFTGADRGWRGNAGIQLNVDGTPADLALTLDASLGDFRRYDIAMGSALGLTVHCIGHYKSALHLVHDGKCSAPLGSGLVQVRGGGDGASIDLTGSIQVLPVASAVELLRRAKKNLAGDLAATGLVNGEFVYRRSGESSQLEGTGKMVGLALASAANDTDVSLDNVALTLVSGAAAAKRGKQSEGNGHSRTASLPATTNAHLEFGPVLLPLGGTTPVSIEGQITRQGYDLAVHGEGSVARTLRLARMLGLPAPQSEMQGAAEANLDISGLWRGSDADHAFAPPRLAGTARLRQARFSWQGRPVELNTADLNFQPDRTRISHIEAVAAGAHWTGTVDRLRGCTALQCAIEFDLNANEIDPGKVRAWIAPAAARQPWYGFFQANPPSSPQMHNFKATGTIHARRVVWRQWTANEVGATVDLGEGKIALSHLTAGIFDGTHDGDWKADYSVKPAVIEGVGKFSGVHFTQFAALLHDDTLSSAAGNATYQIKASGNGPAGADFKIIGSATIGREKRVITGTLAEPKMGTAAREIAGRK